MGTLDLNTESLKLDHEKREEGLLACVLDTFPFQILAWISKEDRGG